MMLTLVGAGPRGLLVARQECRLMFCNMLRLIWWLMTHVQSIFGGKLRLPMVRWSMLRVHNRGQWWFGWDVVMLDNDGCLWAYGYWWLVLILAVDCSRFLTFMMAFVDKRPMVLVINDDCWQFWCLMSLRFTMANHCWFPMARLPSRARRFFWPTYQPEKHCQGIAGLTLVVDTTVTWI